MASLYPVVVIVIATISSMLAAHCVVSYSDAHAADQPVSLAQLTVEDLIQQANDLQSSQRVEATLELGARATEDATLVQQVGSELLKLIADDNELVRAAAEISLNRMGESVVPVIDAALDHLDEFGLGAVCTAIKSVGPAAAATLPKLSPMLASGDPVRQRAVLYALQGMGHKCLPLLDDIIDCLASEDFNVQCFACRVLEPLGPDAYPAEKALLNVLKNGNPSTRGWAAIVLGAIGPTAETDVASLLEQHLIEAQSHVEKQRILLGLAYLGPEAKRAEPTIQQYFETEHHHVQPHAAYALYRINGQQEPMIKAMKVSLDNRDQQFDAFDLVSLLDGEESLPLLNVLRGKLGSEDEDARERAVLAIGKMGPPAADALSDLEAMQNDKDALVRSAVAESIAAITAPVEEPENVATEE